MARFRPTEGWRGAMEAGCILFWLSEPVCFYLSAAF
uniref:Uncharacterized protein n=1 Tax=Arundo donax TaxID=35708 RepID=A0A0A9C1L4_ARUDO